MDGLVLERIYHESLEERIISYIAEHNSVALEKAMSIYYGSKLANKIHEGMEGIQYLDYKVLGDILKETEAKHLLWIASLEKV